MLVLQRLDVSLVLHPSGYVFTMWISHHLHRLHLSSPFGFSYNLKMDLLGRWQWNFLSYYLCAKGRHESVPHHYEHQQIYMFPIVRFGTWGNVPTLFGSRQCMCTCENGRSSLRQLCSCLVQTVAGSQAAKELWLPVFGETSNCAVLYSSFPASNL